MSSVPARAETPPGAPLSSRVCDGVVVWFAVWTACTHAAVAAGASLHGLLAAFAGVGAAVGALLWRLRPWTAWAPPQAAAAEPPRIRWVLQLAGGAAGLAVAGVSISRGDVVLLWWGGALLLGAAAVPFLLVEAPTTRPPLRGRGPELALWAVGALCVFFAIAVHRPDIDDTFYVNVAVAAADAPDAPLLRSDTLLGVEGLPLHQPAHRIHTYELWNGAVAWGTGIPAIYVFHWLAAGAFGLLLPLAHARLFRLLVPRTWPAAVAVLVLVLLGVGETHHWYGNFALVRMWQGKAVALFVFLPLVATYALQLALRPSVAGFGLLLAAQVAAVGCSSTAVWAAPVTALTALAAALRPSPQGLRRLAIGALASLYPVAVGLVLRSDIRALATPQLEAQPFGEPLLRALHTVLGEGGVLLAGLAAVLAGWACWQRGLARRYAIAVPLAVWLVLLDPYAAEWMRSHVTGPSYWRAMWVLPIPVLLSLVLTAPLQLRGSARARLAGAAACAAACLAFLAFVPAFSALSARNAGAAGVGIRVGRPGPKAPEIPYRWAAALNAAVPPGSPVVAPPEVSVWIPTFHHHAHPLQARRLYLANHTARLGEADVALRILMTRYVGAADVPDGSRALFERGLVEFGVVGVVLRNSGRAVEARAILAASGFQRTVHAFDYEIWVRR